MPPNRIVGGVGSAFEPACHDRFALRVEQNRFASLDVQVAEEGLVPAGEGEPGHRSGDADVYADHSGVEVLLELAGGVAALREDRCAVAVWRFSADLQGLF